MSHAISILPIVPIRKLPSHRSEMVSQLLFGEAVTVMGEEDHFLNVITGSDHYEGWIHKGQLLMIDAEACKRTGRFTSGFVTDIIVNGQLVRIPYGCEMVNMKSDPNTVPEIIYTPDVKGNDFIGMQPFSAEALQTVSRTYLNTPYLWGGRSVFGIDCSGFTQQVFRFFGVNLQRDAYLQVRQGKEVNDPSKARTGDLAFFNNEEGKVVHVGIVLTPGKIIHASAWVRTDSFTDEGIFHQGTRTHQLHSIRRLVE